MSETIQKKRSLFNILKLMADFDDEVAGISIEEFKEVVGELPDKIDSCRDFISSVECRVDYLKTEIAELQSRKKSMENTINNFKQYLVSTMETMEVDKLQGANFSLSLGSRKTIDLKEGKEITNEMYAEIGIIDPTVIKKEYKINKTNFKRLCSKVPDILKKYGQESVKSFAQFRRKKGV